MEARVWQSRLQMGSTVSTMVMPMISSSLASRSLRLPLYISAALCVLNMALIRLFVSETLPPEDRTPWRWSSSNPFSLVQLFCNGGRLRTLCTIAMVDRFAFLLGQIRVLFYPLGRRTILGNHRPNSLFGPDPLAGEHRVPPFILFQVKSAAYDALPAFLAPVLEDLQVLLRLRVVPCPCAAWNAPGLDLPPVPVAGAGASAAEARGGAEAAVALRVDAGKRL